MPILDTSDNRRQIQWCASLQPGSYGFSSQKQLTGIVFAQQTLRATPVYFHRTVSLDRIGFEVTAAGTAGALGRVGVFADNGNLFPGALLLDAGTAAADNIGIKEITIAQVIPAGTVWFAYVTQNDAGAGPQIRAVSGSPPGMGESNAGVATTNISVNNVNNVPGALPALYNQAGTRSGIGARVFWRIAP